MNTPEDNMNQDIATIIHGIYTLDKTAAARAIALCRGLRDIHTLKLELIRLSAEALNAYMKEKAPDQKSLSLANLMTHEQFQALHTLYEETEEHSRAKSMTSYMITTPDIKQKLEDHKVDPLYLSYHLCHSFSQST